MFGVVEARRPLRRKLSWPGEEPDSKEKNEPPTAAHGEPFSGMFCTAGGRALKSAPAPNSSITRALIRT